MRYKRTKRMLVAVAALLCCTALSIGTVYADTDGTEIQVEQPSTLELQLGPQWTGVEFQLKTDAGTYPGTVVVGDDGVLRTELGGSTNYVLSCLNSPVIAPSPDDTQAPATTAPVSVSAATTESEPSDETTQTGNESGEDPADAQDSIGGIPIKHIILFGGGLVLAAGGLITMSVVKKRRTSTGGRQDYEDEDEDD